jgi:hypothetical protein
VRGLWVTGVVGLVLGAVATVCEIWISPVQAASIAVAQETGSASVPRNAILGAGAWCEPVAQRDFSQFMRQLTEAFGRGETVVLVQASDDLEHVNRFVGCKRTAP